MAEETIPIAKEFCWDDATI